MNYPQIPNFAHLVHHIEEYSRLKHEYGSSEVEVLLAKAYDNLKLSVESIKKLEISPAITECEPDDLSEIKKLRPEGPRKLWKSIDKAEFEDKLAGAFLARMAGCTLGAIVEFWTVDQMEKWAKYTDQTFPPVDYWDQTRFPFDIRYGKSDYLEYTRDALCKVPVDDDVTYTLLGLLIAEDHGINFDTKDVGDAWLKYLPYACTAEEIALKNLKANIPALEAADIDNPYVQWIGADIRSDPFAYMAPAYPEKAASMAYYDGYISHRRNGIYGEMFFAAAQAAAFAVDHPVEALKIGLTEIPAECSLAKDVRWALEVGVNIKDYKEARAAVDEHFKGMSLVHTNNNACLTIFGLMIGGTDVTKVISETVAMGLDNDCTAATAGSIVGAIVGKKGMPQHWYKNFNNTVDSYLIEVGEMKIDDVLSRFAIQAEKVYSEGKDA
ncbi:MAG: ADP-ribosylglycohydrolase family protein [Vallitaleaceae bacterium]|nr:ADP-ribosylglycohydrolase family protein [Vallitaleaceae bacterium]